MARAFITLMLTSVATAISNSANLTHNNVVACCRSLANDYNGQVYYPNDEAYSAWDDRWTGIASLEPRCIFTPTCAEQVSAAVKTFATAAGREGVCPFAINSGGGMAWAGSNDIHDGVTLDLRRLNTTVISEDRTFVSVGAGNTWERVYESLVGSNLAIPGGRNIVLGVGGLTLGGGYSWLTPKVGFVVDNVVNFEIVLASGEIRQVSNESGYDLFMALKGGGNNLGVVTRVDIAAFDHDQKFYGGELTMSSHSTNESVVKCLHEFMDVGVNDPDAYANARFRFWNASDGSADSYSITIETAALDDKKGHAGLTCFEAFAHPAVLWDWTDHTTFSSVKHYARPWARALPATATFKPLVGSHDVIRSVQQIGAEVYWNFTHIAGLMWDLEYQPLGRTYRDHGLQHGGNIMGLNYTDADLMMVHLTASWDLSSDDREAAKAVELWLARVQEYTNVINASYPYLSPNYAGAKQDPLASYGVHNLAFLRDVARKYDPDRLFQDAVPGGFKLKDAAS